MGTTLVLKMVVDTGKLNRAVHWMDDARWVKDGRVWNAAGVTVRLTLGILFLIKDG